MKIAIYCRYKVAAQAESALQLMQHLRPKKVQVLLYERFFRGLPREQQEQLSDAQLFTEVRDLPQDVLCLVSIGGDGTFLEAASLVVGTNIPIVGVSAGRLGFLACITIEKAGEAIEDILARRFTVEHRAMLQVEGCSKAPQLALNEVCLQKRGAAIAEISVRINGCFLNNYWADGLIVATPTGSTAYSLSTGGPIVAPDADCLIVSPIAPHNLSVRPVVVPDSVTVELEMVTRSGSLIVGVDSQSYELPVGTTLKVKKAATKIGFIRFSDCNFYNTLRNKLLWGVDTRG
jgi:NAD+ kinase